MAQIAALPTPDIWIAFAPTNIQAAYQQAAPVAGNNVSNSYWTSAASYLREFQTNLSRQHYLSRVEPATAQFVLDNRDGFFTNGTKNGTGYVIQPRQPVKIAASYQVGTSTTSNTIGTGTKTFTIQTGLGIDNAEYGRFTSGSNYMYGSITSYNSSTGVIVLNITATSGSGTFTSWNFTATWPIFFGIIDSVEERLTDQLNSDLLVNVSDICKYLSLRELSNPSFWKTYAQPTNVSTTSSSSVTVNGTSATFTVPASLGFVTGATILIGAGTSQNPTAGMYGTVSSYSGTTLVVTVYYQFGSGTYTSWTISQTSSKNWYALGGAPPISITKAVGNGTTTTYSCVHNFAVGQTVTISGMGTPQSGTTGSPNASNKTITAVTASSFSISSTFNGTTNSNGVVFSCAIPDNLQQGNGVYTNPVSFPPHGALIYSPSNCTDLSAGTNGPSGYASFGNGTTSSGIDFWILGQGINNHTIAYNTATSSGLTYTIALNVTADGTANVAVTQGATTTNYALANITDGYWHHIGLTIVGGFIYGCFDGIFTVPLLATTTFNSGQWNVGKAISSSTPVLAAYIDEVVLHNSTITMTDIVNRFIAGTLLQRGYPISQARYQPLTSTTTLTAGTGNKTLTVPLNYCLPTNAQCVITNGTITMTGLIVSYDPSTGTLVVNVQTLSGSGSGSSWTVTVTIAYANVSSIDRIAEILTLSGYGTVSGGKLVLLSASGTPDLLYLNESTTAYADHLTYYGMGTLDTEPFYWDTPVIGLTALDLISQITDTDTGAFYQELDGTFSFYSQSYYGTWSFNTTTPSASTWTKTYTAPTGDHVWSDDGSSTYYYQHDSCRILADDADVWTAVRIAPQSGTEQVYENLGNWYGTVTANQRFGYTTLRKSNTLHSTLSSALSTAYFLGYLYREPLWRVQNVELSAKISNGANITAILNTEFGDVVNFTRVMPNASTTSTAGYPIGTGKIAADMVVESVRHDFRAEQGEWTTSFTLDPYPVRS